MKTTGKCGNNTSGILAVELIFNIRYGIYI
jgi:hypothetical protein